MRKAAGIAVAVSIVSVLMLVGAGGAGAKTHARATALAAGAHGLGALIPTHKGRVLPLHGGTTDSLNWSGYAVTPSADNVTAVSSTFTETPLANVGTVSFGPTSTYTAGGTTHTIAEEDPTTIDLSPGVVNEATPSALASDGQSFNDCAYEQTCPTP